MNETRERLEEARRKVDEAWEMVRRLCLPRTDSESREWIMSIPVQPTDPDVVIAKALSAARDCLTEIDRLSKRCADLEAEKSNAMFLAAGMTDAVIRMTDPATETPTVEETCRTCAHAGCKLVGKLCEWTPKQTGGNE